MKGFFNAVNVDRLTFLSDGAAPAPRQKKVYVYDDEARKKAKIRYERRKARMFATGRTVHGLKRVGGRWKT